MKAMKLGEEMGILMNQHSNSVILKRVEGIVLDNMTTEEKVRYFRGFCKTTGENRLFEILGLA